MARWTAAGPGKDQRGLGGQAQELGGRVDDDGAAGAKGEVRLAPEGYRQRLRAVGNMRPGCAGHWASALAIARQRGQPARGAQHPDTPGVGEIEVATAIEGQVVGDREVRPQRRAVAAWARSAAASHCPELAASAQLEYFVLCRGGHEQAARGADRDIAGELEPHDRVRGRQRYARSRCVLNGRDQGCA